MKRERSDSKAKPKRRGGAASSRSREARPALQRSRPAGKPTGSGKAAGSGNSQGRSAGEGAGKKATRKAAAAARPPAAPKPKKAERKAPPPPKAVAPRTRKAASAAAPPRARAVKAKPPEKIAPPAPAPPARPRKASTRTEPVLARKAEADVTDEERIESAKYLTGEQPRRVFEEERFVFPETYGRNRVRLLVKDPQWLFAHWDVDPGVISGLRSELGERAAALSRLTLKVTDPEHGGGAVIHLPADARSWYVRADRVRRAYRAELGLTLPSGEYRVLATSNIVRPPQGSPSHRHAARRARYVGPRRAPVGAAAEWSETEAAGGEPGRPAAPRRGGPGPWQPTLVDSRPRGERGAAGTDAADGAEEKGGASDVHGPRPSGASDLYRR